MKQWFLLLFSLTPLYSASAWAAACCGGGFASPTLIVGDQQTQFTASSTYGEVVVDNVDSDGYWRRFENHTTVKTLRLDGATLLSDRVQAGFAIPVVDRNRLGVDYSGLGDVTASLGYEYLTDWTYDPIRPKGIGFIQLTLPTGKSRFESDDGGLDSRGNGFLALGAGTLLTKIIKNWDVFLTFEGHRSFSKTVNTDLLNGTLKPGYGTNFGLGGGYNFQSVRLGGSLIWTIENPITFTGSGTEFDSGLERYATASLSVSYLASEEWAGTVSYIDQTWFGSPLNTSLARSVLLQLQRRWLR